ncbi:hypothetical protein PTSG_10231 [Salpingoeca rosetta]|uniref:Afadin and alpha-actinin-binding-domain-containing protein n=1 Tax=Salpingoeca rosetta (strain ATCC 50818 / BSB-021) TaxID=946362 RepID=F2UQP4_SALR5|nr:uncharacterized protein PTSG_10231 [Salpingoeca rosetta]EGD79949.1 hypothetical protein PTSG_10231 [Salpingoeca rosetta]|eukprot:XP_004988570.1 hypothetical protein PTSG_10231 [Salpingoeca rosetta]
MTNKREKNKKGRKQRKERERERRTLLTMMEELDLSALLMNDEEDDGGNAGGDLVDQLGFGKGNGQPVQQQQQQQKPYGVPSSSFAETLQTTTNSGSTSRSTDVSGIGRGRGVSASSEVDDRDLAHRSTHIDHILDILGISPLNAVDRCQSPEDAHASLEVVERLLDLHRYNKRMYEDLQSTMDRLKDDRHQQDLQKAELKNTIREVERARDQVQEELRQARVAISRLQSDLKTQQAESKRVKQNADTLINQHVHERKRLQRQYDALREALSKKISQQESRGLSIHCLNEENRLTRAGGSRGKWAVPKNAAGAIESEMQEMLERRVHALKDENDHMRQALASLDVDLGQVLRSANVPSSPLDESSTSLNDSFDARRPLGSGQFQLPFDVAGERIERSLKKKMQHLQRQLEDVTRRHTENTDTEDVAKLKAEIAELKEVMQQQQQLLLEAEAGLASSSFAKEHSFLQSPGARAPAANASFVARKETSLQKEREQLNAWALVLAEKEANLAHEFAELKRAELRQKVRTPGALSWLDTPTKPSSSSLSTTSSVSNTFAQPPQSSSAAAPTGTGGTSVGERGRGSSALHHSVSAPLTSTPPSTSTPASTSAANAGTGEPGQALSTSSPLREMKRASDFLRQDGAHTGHDTSGSNNSDSNNDIYRKHTSRTNTHTSNGNDDNDDGGEGEGDADLDAAFPLSSFSPIRRGSAGNSSRGGNDGTNSSTSLATSVRSNYEAATPIMNRLADLDAMSNPDGDGRGGGGGGGGHDVSNASTTRSTNLSPIVSMTGSNGGGGGDGDRDRDVASMVLDERDEYAQHLKHMHDYEYRRFRDQPTLAQPRDDNNNDDGDDGDGDDNGGRAGGRGGRQQQQQVHGWSASAHATPQQQRAHTASTHGRGGADTNTSNTNAKSATMAAAMSTPPPASSSLSASALVSPRFSDFNTVMSEISTPRPALRSSAFLPSYVTPARASSGGGGDGGGSRRRHDDRGGGRLDVSSSPMRSDTSWHQLSQDSHTSPQYARQRQDHQQQDRGEGGSEEAEDMPPSWLAGGVGLERLEQLKSRLHAVGIVSPSKRNTGTHAQQQQQRGGAEGTSRAVDATKTGEEAADAAGTIHFAGHDFVPLSQPDLSISFDGRI